MFPFVFFFCFCFSAKEKEMSNTKGYNTYGRDDGAPYDMTLILKRIHGNDDTRRDMGLRDLKDLLIFKLQNEGMKAASVDKLSGLNVNGIAMTLELDEDTGEPYVSSRKNGSTLSKVSSVLADIYIMLLREYGNE
jgi:hypothetical protein